MTTKYWKTKDGKLVKYKDLKDSHLWNILKWIERKAEEGITIMTGGGFDLDDMWYDENTLEGNTRASAAAIRFTDNTKEIR